MSLHFLTNGLLATIQDTGRPGYRRFGVNPGGAMDRKALRLINCLLGNDENEAVIEMHFPAPKISFEKNAIIALGGAEFGAMVDGKEIPNWRPIFVKKGANLSFRDRRRGRCLYLAVKGGFKLKKWLKSYSTNLLAQSGGFEGRALQKGNKLQVNITPTNPKFGYNFYLSPDMIPAYSDKPVVRVLQGGEWERINRAGRERFQDSAFTLTPNSNRMGYALKGGKIELSKKFELISSAVNFGTIQLLPNGQLIMLMADHQTTGGYPRIANVIAEDLPLLAQLNPNDQIRFKLVSLQEAENLALNFEKNLKLLKIGVNSWQQSKK